jgi:predicted RNase H-like nuclease
VTAVLGVDGARGGWIGALVDGDVISWLPFSHLQDALAQDVVAVGVDMPMGLPAQGRRECDLLAKRRLGRAHPRVFLTPPRAVLDASSYDDAGARHRAHTGGLGLSVQTWHIVDKMREADSVAEAVADDDRLIEVHPELSFAALAGSVLPSKHTPAGRAARLAALRGHWPELPELPRGATAVDAIDALAVAWSTLRFSRGESESLPDQPQRDERGRLMRIVV